MVALADKIFATNPSTARRSALPAKRSATYWLQNSDTQLITQRAPFYPCKHSGSCKSAQCRCFRENVTCEKTCACSADCNRRFRGCKCAQVGQICFQSQGCACFTLNRECDADLCGTCGAAEVLDPENRYNTEIGKAKCTNVYMQKNMPKRTLLGHSEVHGFGLFMGEPVKAHDYLGEYKGETLTKGESDRRSTIYQYQRTSYTFDLNKGRNSLRRWIFEASSADISQIKRSTARDVVTSFGSSTIRRSTPRSTATLKSLFVTLLHGLECLPNEISRLAKSFSSIMGESKHAAPHSTT